MLKQITLYGQRIELHSLDGKTWCSSVVEVIAMKRRKNEIEKHLKTIASHIYLRRVNDKFGTDSEDPFTVHLR